MKTLEELRSFAEGYRHALLTCNVSLPDVDDWVLWGGYDVNFTGSYLIGEDLLGPFDLRVTAYPGGWRLRLPDPLQSFDVSEPEPGVTDEERSFGPHRAMV